MAPDPDGLPTKIALPAAEPEAIIAVPPLAIYAASLEVGTPALQLAESNQLAGTAGSATQLDTAPKAVDERTTGAKAKMRRFATAARMLDDAMMTPFPTLGRSNDSFARGGDETFLGGRKLFRPPFVRRSPRATSNETNPPKLCCQGKSVTKRELISGVGMKQVSRFPNQRYRRCAMNA